MQPEPFEEPLRRLVCRFGVPAGGHFFLFKMEVIILAWSKPVPTGAHRSGLCDMVLTSCTWGTNLRTASTTSASASSSVIRMSMASRPTIRVKDRTPNLLESISKMALSAFWIIFSLTRACSSVSSLRPCRGWSPPQERKHFWTW